MELDETLLNEIAGPGAVLARRAVIVAGAHRSGTSALTRVLSLTGCDLPRHVMPPLNGSNELGFWEPEKVVEAHEAYLAMIRSSWDDVGPLPEGAFTSPPAIELRQRLSLLLREEFAESSLFVVKDPRISRLLPLWYAVMEGLEVTPSTVIAVRNPLEVAASLKARDGFTTTKSLLLWLRYTLEAEQHSRGHSRSVVYYDELLHDWQGILSKVGDDLGLTWPGKSHRAVVEVENFLSGKQRHHSFDWNDLTGRADVVDWVKETYFALRTSDPEPVLDHVRDELAQADIAFGPILAEVRLALEAAQAEALETAAKAEIETAAAEARLQAEVKQLALEREAAAKAEIEAAAAEARLQAEVKQLTLAREQWRRTANAYEEDRDRWQERAENAESEGARLAEDLEAARAEAAAIFSARLRRRWLAFSQFLAWLIRGKLGYLRRFFALRRSFDTAAYLAQNPDVAAAGLHPLLHYIEHGAQEGRDFQVGPPSMWARRSQVLVGLLSWLARGRLRYVRQYFALRRSFDYDGYLAANSDVAAAGLHPLLHYIEHGAHEGRELQVGPPSVWARRSQVFRGLLSWLARGRLRYVRQYFVLRRSFNYDGYIAANPDVAAAGLHPLLHYIEHGAREGRVLEPPPWAPSTEEIAAFLQERPAQLSSPHLLAAADEVRRRVQPGPEFEEFDPQIAANAPPRAKAIAFYLPQFHAIPENDEWWGKGFTEWTNVARGYPRFIDHYQPRRPRDLGFYDLEQEGILERQVELARAAGIHGFSFYYYWFDGKRLLEKPLERFLADPSIDFPFCLTWANENWTRRWDGFEDDLLMEQTYDPDRDADLIDDLQRHFDDDRYIRIEGRPLLLIYRIDLIPDLRNTVDRWREIWKRRHAEDPLILAAQSFWNIEDPRLFGLDGAIEFPPHRAALECGILNSELQVLDPSFTAEVISYPAVMEASLSGPQPNFPLVKTIIPSWDNDARREGQGHLVHGSTPELYENWLRGLIDIATAYPVGGESFVFINAWNEWAEGAYLEPDVHYGAAYLNATARALCAPRSAKRPKKAYAVGGEVGVAAEDTHTEDSRILTAELRATLEGEFDRGYYLAAYADIREAGVDPLKHYFHTGWREARDPSAEFSTSYYLSANPDVAAAQVNPFAHYVLTGRTEGRPPRRTGGLRREMLETLRSVDEELELFRETHPPVAAPIADGSLTRLLVERLGARRHVVISCSHDDYTRIAGGVELCVKLEEAAFVERDCAYINLHSAQQIHVLSRETEPEALMLAVVCDGETLGAASAEAILSALTHLGSEGVDFGLVVHALHGHSPEVVAELHERLSPQWAWLWLHDFFLVCPGTTLLRNKIEPCHAPPPESTGCMICVYGAERLRHIERIRELLDKVPFKLAAPSQFMADRWKEYFGNPELEVTVHEHGTMTRAATKAVGDGIARVPLNGPARIAFLNQGYHKGWEVFRELARRYGPSGEYRFYHLVNGAYPEPFVEQRRVSVAEDGPHAMTEALRADAIDVAVLWSIVEESFSFTTREALAAGVAVITNEGSGNVASVVKASGNGLVFGDQQELFDAFEDGSLLELVRSNRSTQQREPSHFVHSNMTADLVHFDD